MANAGVPDFTQAVHHVNQAAAEFSQQFRLLNVTPAAQLQLITTQLQQINQQLQQLNRSMTEVRTEVRALYGILFNLSTSHRFLLILNRNSNMIARLQNSHAKSHDYLMPLVDCTTGIPIPVFPQDSQAIGQMNGKIASPIMHYSYLTK